MEIILKEDVANLGYKDDVVNVKSGYGRNFLIPQGKAVIASVSAKKVLAEKLRQRAHKLEQIRLEAQALAAKLEGTSLTVAVRTSSSGTIYGSVTGAQIAEELAKKGFDIDRKVIGVTDSIKETGSYTAVVRLHKDAVVEIPFEVVSENPKTTAKVSSDNGAAEVVESLEVAEASEASATPAEADNNTV
ncbi:MAG: 50S ribosomal protein L9 [Tannerella sp.]|jgi:large subunit ribosomal protein L9|nr:50S ribosomal protein L9 [Tannerella sp.]